MSDSAQHPVAGIPALRKECGSFLWEPGPIIVVVSGPSGAGKDAVIRRLRSLDGSIHFVVTATSRPPRPDEVDGRDYHFLTRDEFERRLERGEFLEHATVYGDYKGVPRWELTRALECGQDVVLRVDVQGARTLRALLPEAVFVFLMADSEEEHLRRLHGRGSEDDRSLTDRLAQLEHELQALADFDYVVINRRDALEQAADQIASIMTAEKLCLRRGRRRPG